MALRERAREEHHLGLVRIQPRLPPPPFRVPFPIFLPISISSRYAKSWLAWLCAFHRPPRAYLVLADGRRTDYYQDRAELFIDPGRFVDQGDIL